MNNQQHGRQHFLLEDSSDEEQADDHDQLNPLVPWQELLAGGQETDREAYLVLEDYCRDSTSIMGNY